MNPVSAGAASQSMRAVKSFGILVKLSHNDFLALVEKDANALILKTRSKMWFFGYRYLISYKGFAFYTNSTLELKLPKDREIMLIDRIVIPG